VGVIDLFTAKPQIGVFTGSAEVNAGDFNSFGTRGMLNIPVNDTLAFRIAYASQKHDGYVSFQPTRRHSRPIPCSALLPTPTGSTPPPITTGQHIR